MKDTIQATFLNAAREARTDLIHQILSDSLAPMFRTIFSRTNRTDQTFEESLDDFLLFLYYGPEYIRKAGLPPYSIILRIRKPASVFSWLASAYRIRLLQTNATLKPPVFYSAADCSDSSACSCKELCDAISKCIQDCSPTGRFLVIRWLLTALEPSNAIPQKHIADAVGITPANYRVCTSRCKSRLSTLLQKRRKAVFSLKSEYKSLSEYLQSHSDTLYDCLLSLYDDVIAALPNATKIQDLRMRMSNEAGRLLHEK